MRDLDDIVIAKKAVAQDKLAMDDTDAFEMRHARGNLCRKMELLVLGECNVVVLGIAHSIEKVAVGGVLFEAKEIGPGVSLSTVQHTHTQQSS